MLILALDTAGASCGAALAEEERLLAEVAERAGWNHARRLLPLVDHALRAAGRRPEELAAVAVTAGPGSWTGLRVGLATAQGLGLALGVPVVPVGSLAALAWGAGPRPGPVCALLDARGGGVYAGLFAWEGWRLVSLLAATRLPRACWLDRVAEAVAAGPCYFVGEGLDVWEREVVARFGREAVAPPPLRAIRPGAVATLGFHVLAGGGAVDPADVRPVYGDGEEAPRRREEGAVRRGGGA